MTLGTNHDPKIRRIYNGKLNGVRFRECNTDKIIDSLGNTFIICKISKVDQNPDNFTLNAQGRSQYA
jgi:hypothetical protein